MRKWLAGVRRILGRDDARAAYETERGEIRAALARPAIDPRIIAESERLLARRRPSTVVLGSAVADPNVLIPLDLAGLPSSTHALVVGASGSGKTRLLALMCRQVVHAQLSGEPLGLFIHGPKNDFGELVVDLLAQELVRIAPAERERFISGYRYIDPFRESGPPVPLNILAPIPGVPPEVQAYEVSSSMAHVGGEGMGPNQTTFLYYAILAAIGRATLPALYEITGDAVRLASFGAGSPHNEVREFFATQRLATRAVEGIRSRLHSLLRVPAARRCLEAETCLSFTELLGNRVSILSTGGPPLGCEDIGKTFNLVFASRMGRAVFARRDRGEVPCLVMLDEFQEIIGAGPYAAETAQRLLNQARSRNVSLVLATQTLASVARASSALPEIATTNAGVIVAFRSSPADFRALADALPTTGRRLRPRPAPWETPERTPYLSTDDERRALLAEASGLAPRCFWLWNRTVSGGAVLVRSADVEMQPEDAERAQDLLRPQAAQRDHGRDAGATGKPLTRPAGLFRVRRAEQPEARGFRLVDGDAARRAPRTEAAADEDGRGQEGGGQEGPRPRGRGRPRRRGA